MAEQETAAASQPPSPSTPTPPDPPLVRAGRVANIVNLESVRFAQFSATSDASEDDLKATKFAHRAYFTRPKPTVNGRFVSVSSTFLLTVTKAVADNTAENSDDTSLTAEALATLRATVEIMYSVKDDTQINIDDLREFANVNVPFNSWGYWREFVQSALARMGFTSTVTLPLFRVQTANLWMIDNEPKTE